MTQSYNKFRKSLNRIAPKVTRKAYDGKTRRIRSFFNQEFTSKEGIIDYVKTFPQLDTIGELRFGYKKRFEAIKSRDSDTWDIGLVLWIAALAESDYGTADEIRDYCKAHGVGVSKFDGNIFIRTP